MKHKRYRFLFLFFFLSGFCSLLYQVIWVRLAYASFGVITPVMSVVISVFMLGLAIGSWVGGAWIDPLRNRFRITSLSFYGFAELSIGLCALLVPVLFRWGSRHLLGLGAMDSTSYLASSAWIIGLTILPACIFMGFTFPFMMSFVREVMPDSTTGFSYLYLANVVGAAFGAIVTALVLIELFGFSRTLLIATAVNLAIAFSSFHLSRRFAFPKRASRAPEVVADARRGAGVGRAEAVFICVVLFATGFISMSMEVVWVRAFTPVLKTMTYSFASLLAVYLVSTWLGSFWYRRHLANDRVVGTDRLLAILAVVSFFPLTLTDPRLNVGVFTALCSIVPFCATLGYLTPMLIDTYSAGRPFEAGKAYALNVLGCILGPLVAAYGLLPRYGVRFALIGLGLPLVIAFLVRTGRRFTREAWIPLVSVVVAFVLIRAMFVNVTYEEAYASLKGAEIRRDQTATVVSYGQGWNRQLLVNGIGMTKLTVITKLMAHLPLAFHSRAPRSALVICFGMGTTYRSILSWGIKGTAVELTPSVLKAFDYYFPDAARVRSNPNGRMVADDGRRFLKRTQDQFDVITLDPPPPIEAAGSSLLYSEEFYEDVKARLAPGGILQAWFPGGELETLQAFARSLATAFPHVRVFRSVEGWGFHFLASMDPIPDLSPEEMIAHMPPDAAVDLGEWFADREESGRIVSRVLGSELDVNAILSSDRGLVIRDDRPFNEYFLMRQTLARWSHRYRMVR